MGARETGGRRIVVVGGGKMGEAILTGWIRSDAEAAADISAGSVVVVEPGDERRRHLRDICGVACVADAADIPSDFVPDVVVLSVKPQVMMGVLAHLRELPAFGGAPGAAHPAHAEDAAHAAHAAYPASAADAAHPADAARTPLFVSIAAGLTTAAIDAALPAGARLVRVMPNMPLMVGAGASGVCAGAWASDEDVRHVADLFGCLGRAVVVDEDDMDAVCALSGSGPAYVAAMVEALRDAAAARGLHAELAEALALQTVLGTARLIDETDLTPQAAREAVCSPGGTTLAALDAMNAAGFADVVDAGIAAAIRRSKELAQCSS